MRTGQAVRELDSPRGTVGAEAMHRAAMCHASALELVRLHDEPGRPYAAMPEDCEVAARWREGRGRRPDGRG